MTFSTISVTFRCDESRLIVAVSDCKRVDGKVEVSFAPKMKHFLVTRFNLTLDSWKTAKDGQKVLTDAWLSHRFWLFERYCLPSVMNQSNQDFIWCVFFDVSTPQAYRSRIAELSLAYDNFVPVYIDGFEALLDAFQGFVAAHLDHGERYVITSRLDNDDLIHREFIDTVQRLSHGADNGADGVRVIDLRKGYQLSIETEHMELRKGSNPFGPFISVVEDAANFRTVLSRMHRDWRDARDVVVFDAKRLWIELVHEKNKLNGVRRSFVMIAGVDAQDFGVPFELKTDHGPWVVALHNLGIVPYYGYTVLAAVGRLLLKLLGTRD